MRRRWARFLLVGPLFVAATLAGCATGNKPRSLNAARQAAEPDMVAKGAGAGGPWRQKSLQPDESDSDRDSRPLPSPRHSESAAPIQLASYAQPPPAEPIAAPSARLANEARPSLPIDLATALAMTQGQNPRVAFA